ncbi:hypothetical protein R3P38DRAFT_3175781 [Favolaschia claudopus]|uniref:Uncharacterized protein n=1 Tax=Favolaschia claudopus TaxID=2862362 RepID=A0AAW0D1W6_9AGAR
MASSSYASLTGVIVLEKPRVVAGKTFVFDGHYYLGTDSQESILASLRYFNHSNIEFPDVGVYFTYATIAKMDVDAGLNLFLEEGSNVQPHDYALVGDIQILVPLGAPDEVDIDLRRRPYIHIAGAAINPDSTKATWTMDADQYNSAYREANKKLLKGAAKLRSFMPVQCTIPDGSRYTNSQKPVPYKGRYLMATGYLSDITNSLGNDGKINERFCIEVDNVAFLGTVAATAAKEPSSSASTPASAGSSKRGWSFSGSCGDKKGKKRARVSDVNDGLSFSQAPAPFGPGLGSSSPLSSPSPSFSNKS